MDTIVISDLEVYYQVGVTEAERAKPQRLLLTLEITHDFKAAVASDDLAETIDYDSICRRLLKFGEGCHWRLIETLAADIASMVIEDFGVASVLVQVKKFIIPEAQYVGVRVRRP